MGRRTAEIEKHVRATSLTLDAQGGKEKSQKPTDMPANEQLIDRAILHLLVTGSAIIGTLWFFLFGLPLCPSAGGPPETTPWGLIVFIVAIEVYIATFTALRLKGKWQQFATAKAGISTRIWFALDWLLLAGLLASLVFLPFSGYVHNWLGDFCFDPR